jgi:hypothetical protein
VIFNLLRRCHSIVLSRERGLVRRLEEIHKCMASYSGAELYKPIRESDSNFIGTESDYVRNALFGSTPKHTSKSTSSCSQLRDDDCILSVQLSVEHEVLYEIVRFVYTGKVRHQVFHDPGNVMIQLLIQGDYLSIDSLVDLTISWIRENEFTPKLFYDLESVLSRRVLLGVHNLRKLNKLLI